MFLKHSSLYMSWLHSKLLPKKQSQGKKTIDKAIVALPSDQQDCTLNKDSIGTLQCYLPFAIGRALLAFSMF